MNEAITHEVMVTLRDAERALHDTMPTQLADVVLAALSAEPETLAELETAIAESKTALAGEDTDAMNTAFDRLQTASHKLAEALYSQAGTPAGDEGSQEQASSASATGDGGSTTGSDEGDVIDAEYVDVEDEDKK